MHADTRQLPTSLTLDAATAAVVKATAAPADAIERWTSLGGHAYGYYWREGDGHRIHLYGVGSFAFSTHSTQVRGAPEPGVEPDIFYASFCREVAPFVLQRHSWEVLHASGLVVADQPIALCGDSETGKSTLADAWHRRGGPTFADDAIPFRIEGRAARLDWMPFRLRPRTPHGEQSRCREAPARAEEYSARQNALGPDAALGAVYLLERRCDDGDAAVRLEPLAPTALLPELLYQAYCLTLGDRERNRQMVAAYMGLANGTPACRLSYPTGLQYVDSILDCVAEHVRQHFAQG